MRLMFSARGVTYRMDIPIGSLVLKRWQLIVLADSPTRLPDLPSQIEWLEGGPYRFTGLNLVRRVYDTISSGWGHVDLTYTVNRTTDRRRYLALWSGDNVWLQCGMCELADTMWCAWCRERVAAFNALSDGTKRWVVAAHRAEPRILSDWVQENIGPGITIRESGVVTLC